MSYPFLIDMYIVQQREGLVISFSALNVPKFFYKTFSQRLRLVLFSSQGYLARLPTEFKQESRVLSTGFVAATDMTATSRKKIELNKMGKDNEGPLTKKMTCTC